MNLYVSLPKNDIELARAAVSAGANGVKVHLNAFHRASGNTFGSFDEELPFLKQLSRLSVTKLIMVGQETIPSEAELSQLEDLGFEGFNLYLKHAKPHLLKSTLRPILALEEGYSDADIEKIRRIPGSWMEASIMSFSDYGKPLTAEDLSIYTDICKKFGRAVIAPSQKKFVPADVPHLMETGLDAILLGIIVTGAEPKTIFESVADFRRAISPDSSHSS